MYAGLSNLVVHVIAALVGFHNLRAHKTVRICFPAFIVLMGVINTVTVLFISSSCKTTV
ncbi:uncharacterized protein DEA37_0003674 [Paragonimus westermani]|uniref:Uncharacterized protein n=1 Tax=Paragonimus westermani TaxID=34504 RepID=A0A5J4P1E3_9TREM|nr:uncharacterized protein DEA37_0003674 [Paragonimus westermani]